MNTYCFEIYYIIGNSLMSTFQYKFDCVNLSSYSWDINKWRFYSYWWPNISVICCCFCISCICTVCENWSTGCEDTSWMKFVTIDLLLYFSYNLHESYLNIYLSLVLSYLLWNALNTNNFFSFLLSNVFDFILIFFSFLFDFRWWRGTWYCSHMTCHMIWHHRPRT